MDNIRNFCIIAHIDHGKSTLADRFLEITGTVSKRQMKDQILDTMELERERGITIKLQPVTMEYKMNGQTYILNLIDTPGHVDFNYEVSRSLAAVEGAILLIDATQGIQAQTIANLYLAIEQNLTIIPVLNKIDLPAANIEKSIEEIVSLLGCDRKEILQVSAKTGQGVEELLKTIIQKIPCPKILDKNNSRALIFDSTYDEFKGVISYVRVFDGSFKLNDKVKFLATKAESEILELGIFQPDLKQQQILNCGQIGYIVTGVKDIEKCRVGDTIALLNNKSVQPLEGYKEVKPMIYAGIFCNNGDEYEKLRIAIQKLKLNDSALVYEPEHSPALGFGFRCGFLGLLHLEVFKERLLREYNLDLIVTVPSVAYRVHLKCTVDKLNKVIKTENIVDEKTIIITSALDFIDVNYIDYIEEPIMKVDIVVPQDYIGAVMTLLQEKRGKYLNTEYINSSLGQKRVILHYKMPLAVLIVDFYDKLKSVTSGYASLNYEFYDYEITEVVRLDILVANDLIEALSVIVYKDDAYNIGRSIVKSLKEVIPRQLFEVKIQAAIGSKIIASERIPPLRKDVTAKLYGGDYSRKQKLLKKQKQGKKKMKALGKVKIPSDAFIKILKK